MVLISGVQRQLDTQSDICLHLGCSGSLQASKGQIKTPDWRMMGLINKFRLHMPAASR
jgi:hypothetical protein